MFYEFELKVIICIGIVIAGAIIDIRTRKIPNNLTFSLVLTGLIYNVIYSGWSGLYEGFLSLIITLGLLIVPYALGMLGAGDVKLMVGIGVLMGYKFSLLNIFIVIIVGGAYSACVIIKQRNIEYLINIIKGLHILLFTRAIKGFLEHIEVTSTTSLPYGVPIMLGTVLTIWYMY
jgi:prepilin peptidase CpaA